MRCSFCEQELVCAACGKAFVPPDPATHQALYQPEYLVVCPACQEPLVCKACGFAYGSEEEEEDEQAR
jgi:hypothetical protein